MKTSHVAPLSMIVGLAIGAGCIQALHAQNKPPAYLISEIEVTNSDDYQKEFLPAATPTIKAHGGRILAAGPPTSLSGAAPTSRASILQFDTMEQLQAWFNSPDYQKAREIGLKYATYRSFAVPGAASP